MEGYMYMFIFPFNILVYQWNITTDRRTRLVVKTLCHASSTIIIAKFNLE